MDDSNDRNRNSLKLNDVEVRSQSNKKENSLKETYKSIPEDILLNNLTGDIGLTPKMVQDREPPNDGSDEKMLGTDESEKLARKNEIKFISGEQQNGDAKIDIGILNAKEFTGMTKDELMKYANDPFWVRLRMIFFILFWAIWFAMLAGAIIIIFKSAKCAAPEPLSWYKQGPLAFMESSEVTDDDIEIVKKIHASGVIYEFSPDDTYSVSEPEVEEKIKKIVESYKDTDIKVILDITPNYVTTNSKLFKRALEDKTMRSPFIWIEQTEVPNNWLSIVNGSAWTEVKPNNFVLSQFGDGKYDLHMNDSIVEKELNAVFEHLIKLGVGGFRLKNSKFFILSKNLKNEVANTDPKYLHTEYGFWTHSQTTFQEGLGDVIHDYSLVVKNLSDSKAFLSIAEDTIRPEVFKTQNDEFGFDLPIYGRFPQVLASSESNSQIQTELENTLNSMGNKTWLQWVYNLTLLNKNIDTSAYNMFIMLMPGVPIIPIKSEQLKDLNHNSLIQIEHIRRSPSYMHGSFELHKTNDVLAYSRIKSGNPGYLVVYNPTSQNLVANLSEQGLPEKMTVEMLSDNYRSNGQTIDLKSKIATNSIPLSPYSAVILTYVPVK